jgi:peptidoglycan/xylan/chitin deacetylase (PgdA/CDA1 family)
MKACPALQGNFSCSAVIYGVLLSLGRLMKATLRALARRAACVLQPRTLVLAYHHVGELDRSAPWVTVSPGRFAEQMAFLAASKMVVPLDDLLRDLRCGRMPRGGRVVITFDDAALDTCTNALPILRRFDLPATVFVPTGLVGKPGPFWWDRLAALSRLAAAREQDLADFFVRGGILESGRQWTADMLWRQLRYLDEHKLNAALDCACQWLGASTLGLDQGAMSWQQLAGMDEDGLVTFGAHSVSHPVLRAMDETRLEAEIAGSRDALGEFKSFRKVFAYPYGDAAAIGKRVESAVRQAGFEAAFTTEEKALTGREDRMALGRVCVDDMALDDFRWAIDHHLGRSAS